MPEPRPPAVGPPAHVRAPRPRRELPPDRLRHRRRGPRRHHRPLRGHHRHDRRSSGNSRPRRRRSRRTRHPRPEHRPQHQPQLIRPRQPRPHRPPVQPRHHRPRQPHRQPHHVPVRPPPRPPTSHASHISRLHTPRRGTPWHDVVHRGTPRPPANRTELPARITERYVQRSRSWRKQPRVDGWTHQDRSGQTREAAWRSSHADKLPSTPGQGL